MLDYGAGTGKLLALLHRGGPRGRGRGAGQLHALPPHVALAGCDPWVRRPKHWDHWDWGAQVGQRAQGHGVGPDQGRGAGAAYPAYEQEAAGERLGQEQKQHQHQEEDEEQQGMIWTAMEGGRLVGWGTDCAAAALGVGPQQVVGRGRMGVYCTVGSCQKPNARVNKYAGVP